MTMSELANVQGRPWDDIDVSTYIDKNLLASALLIFSLAALMSGVAALKHLAS